MMIDKLVIYIVYLMGYLIMISSLLFSWHHLPQHHGLIQEASLTLILKCCIFILSLKLGYEIIRFIFQKKQRSHSAHLCLVIGLFVLLLFPFILVHYFPEYSGNASWLQQQHDTLTWLGGDAYQAHSDRYQFRSFSSNAQDLPFYLSAYQAPHLIFFDGSLSVLRRWVEILGFCPSFLQFVNRGWVFALIGILMMISATWGYYHRAFQATERKNILHGISRNFIWLFGGYLILLHVPLLLAAFWIQRAEKHVSQGNLNPAQACLNKAVFVLPSLQNDTGIILQFGALSDVMKDKKEDYIRLYLAYQLGKSGLKQQSTTEFLALASNQKVSENIRREAIRMLMHITIDTLNSGKWSKASSLFLEIQQLDSYNLISHFHLQLIALQKGDLKLNQHSHQEILQFYKSYQQKEKKSILSASWLMLAQGEYEQNNLEAASFARRKSKGL